MAYTLESGPCFLEKVAQTQTELPEWHHEGRLYIVWLCLRQFNYDEAIRRIKNVFRLYNQKVRCLAYHDTMTEFWTRIMKKVLQDYQQENDFHKIYLSVPDLQNPKLYEQYYDDVLIKSEDARNKFIPPNKRHLA